MSEAVAGEVIADGDHGEMPFRLRDFDPYFSFASIHRFGKTIDVLQTQLMFTTRLALHEWERKHWVTMAVGAVAFLLGSLSTEVMSGGDPMQIGTEGIQSLSGVVFLQMLISMTLWVWFAVQIWSMFPIMRTNAIWLLIFWNCFVVAQILYHQANPNFPQNLVLSDTMMGTLIVLMVFFFIYFFWKAVLETRDLHIEEYHLHEDVRLMELEMAEHSLMGWGFMLVSWTGSTMFSAWAGTHFVADRLDVGTFTLVLHLMAGLVSIPIFMLVIWYPQRMLGQDTVVQVRAAMLANQELSNSSQESIVSSDSTCPECEAPVAITRNKTGEIQLPCPTEGCSKTCTIGSKCSSCKTAAPTRYDCPSCGINAPVMDFLSDVEAW
ncbi:MAG: hypothetical protein DWC04_03715 [Candidatus Poseidoniales archaeon]|nr:MAG: hypothetical protein DWC04_03715 [Candidatus Poseidoniales archaeon]